MRRSRRGAERRCGAALSPPRPNRAPSGPRSHPGQRPPLPPGRPVGGKRSGSCGRALRRGLPALIATPAGNYSSPFNYLSCPAPPLLEPYGGRSAVRRSRCPARRRVPGSAPAGLRERLRGTGTGSGAGRAGTAGAGRRGGAPGGRGSAPVPSAVPSPGPCLCPVPAELGAAEAAPGSPRIRPRPRRPGRAPRSSQPPYLLTVELTAVFVS